MALYTAPDLPTDAVWLNVDRPLTRSDLRARAVVLPCWTSCRCNCLHTLPVLARAKEQLADEPVVFISGHAPR
jgi:hypothetical protein